MDNFFKSDCVELLKDKLASKEISKRDFLRVCAILGAGAAVSSLNIGKVSAAERISLANFGGDTLKAYADVLTNSFERETGISVDLDGSGPLLGSVKKMVDEHSVHWDVIDGDGVYGPKLGPDYLEPIDYTVVNPGAFFPWNKQPLGAGSYVYSHVLTYDTSKLAEAPTSWADFFDLKKFPGKRSMFKWFLCMPEACMLAAGRKPEDVYPIDMKLVLEMVKSLGDNLVLWDSGASSQQLFLDGEVVMGSLWNTRARVLARDTSGRIASTWNQQIVVPATWNIPKGAAHIAAAQRFIASTQDIKKQIQLLEIMGNGPANPAAVALLTDAQKLINPTSHLDKGLIRNDQWYADNYDNELGNWLDAISG